MKMTGTRLTKTLTNKVMNHGWYELSLSDLQRGLNLDDGELTKFEALSSINKLAKENNWLVCVKSKTIIIYAQLSKVA